MALKGPKGPAGTFVVPKHSSKILKGNPLGDPHLRDLADFTGSGLVFSKRRKTLFQCKRRLQGRFRRCGWGLTHDFTDA